MRLEWDPLKSFMNYVKHGVLFEEAAAAFDDPNAKFFHDVPHSEGEIREKVIGAGERGIVVVVFTERIRDVFRIISARKASKGEKRIYAKDQD